MAGVFSMSQKIYGFPAVGLTCREADCYCYVEPFGRTQVSKIVLCVDDSQTMQQVADITFRGTEFQYVGARTVEEAISKAKSQKPTIVLADADDAGQERLRLVPDAQAGCGRRPTCRS